MKNRIKSVISGWEAWFCDLWLEVFFYAIVMGLYRFLFFFRKIFSKTISYIFVNNFWHSGWCYRPMMWLALKFLIPITTKSQTRPLTSFPLIQRNFFSSNKYWSKASKIWNDSIIWPNWNRASTKAKSALTLIFWTMDPAVQN